jgi:hypothetical protein
VVEDQGTHAALVLLSGDDDKVKKKGAKGYGLDRASQVGCSRRLDGLRILGHRKKRGGRKDMWVGLQGRDRIQGRVRVVF